jgi:hypothetical protein
VTTFESQASLAVGLFAREATISDGIEARSFQRQPVLMELDVAELDSILELSCLQLQLHQQAPVVVVRLGEHRSWRAPTGLLDDALDDGR